MSADLELLTVKQAADLTHISESALYRMIEHGEFPVRRYGRSIRIRRAVLEAWILAPEGDPERLATSGNVVSIAARRTGAGSHNSR